MFLTRLFGRRPAHLAPRSARPGCEALEDRCVPTNFVFTVNTTSDSVVGKGSGNTGDLRYCINQVNAPHGNAADTDTIVFAPGVFGAHQTINLSTGGSLEVTDQHKLAIQGPAAGVTLEGNNTFGIFFLDPGTVVNMSGLEIAKGFNSDGGGGISNDGTLVAAACTIDHNSSPFGGGLINYSDGTMTLNNCTINNNSATDSGGGLENDNLLTMTNCTVAQNTAVNFAGGLNNSDRMTLVNCTIVRNSVTSSTGSVGGVESGHLTMINTIVALNTAHTTPDLDAGTITANHDLIGDGTGSGVSNGTNGNQVGSTGHTLNPNLGPLANNGGLTATCALLSGSSAIDAGNDSVTGPPYNLTTDQRGQPRKVGLHVDIGAFEYVPPPPPRFIGRRLGPRP